MLFYRNKKQLKSLTMIMAVISLVVIFLATAAICAIRFRLIQHRTTRQHEGRKIPHWLDTMIDFFTFPTLVWKITSILAVILFSIRCLTNSFELIFVGIFGATILGGVMYKCAAQFTSKIFSKKILEEYGENTIPEC